MRRTVCAFAALAVVLAFAAAVGTAAASRLEVRGAERGIRVTFASFEFRAGFGFGMELAGGRCPVTLEGSFHSSTFRKIAGALIGYVSRASVSEAGCRPLGTEAFAAKMRFLAESLPWHVRYDSFIGRLPSITGVTMTVVGAAVEMYEIVLEETCLYRSTAESPMRQTLLLNERGVVTSMRGDETVTIPLQSGSPFCRREAGMLSGGTGTVSQLGGTGAISVRLI